MSDDDEPAVSPRKAMELLRDEAMRRAGAREDRPWLTERAVRRHMTMTGIQAAGDLRDELLEAGIPKEAADAVYGASLITPEMLEAQREENARRGVILDIRERGAPTIFYGREPLWLRIVWPFYRTAWNIWRYLRRC